MINVTEGDLKSLIPVASGMIDKNRTLIRMTVIPNVGIHFMIVGIFQIKPETQVVLKISDLHLSDRISSSSLKTQASLDGLIFSGSETVNENQAIISGIFFIGDGENLIMMKNENKASISPSSSGFFSGSYQMFIPSNYFTWR